MSSKTAIIDYGVGNTGSILNILKKVGLPGDEAVVTSDEREIRDARRLILPGVGAFDTAVRALREKDLFERVREAVSGRGVPILGICLGMQLLTRGSDEGSLDGLGLIEARTTSFPPLSERLPLPHMGWNSVLLRKREPIAEGLPPDPRFYFVHSYRVECDSPGDVLMETEYGCTFCSAFSRGNIIGVQFHPEKSHLFGMSLMRNYIERY